MQKKLEGEGLTSGGSILMIKMVYLLSILLLLTSFAYRAPNYCKMSDRIVSSYVKEFAKPRRLVLTGEGGAMMDDIQEVFLSFLSYESLDVDQARVLYVEMMEELLKRYNCHEKIRPYLHNFPFEESNIKLRIGFNDANGIRGDGHVAQMGIAKNHELYFAAYNQNKGKFYDLHEESYEEARRIVTGH